MTVFGPRWRPGARSAALAAAVTLALVLIGPLAAALPAADALAFKVFRDGEPLGHHRLAFRRDGGELHVTIDIRLEVKFAFLTVFRYRHSNHEVWRDGQLIAIDTETDDDGESYWLSGQASEAGFLVEGSSGRFLAPAEIMPTSYWNPKTVLQERLLDTQRGRLLAVEIAPAGAETVLVEGAPVNAQRYRMTGDLELDLWYATDDQWSGEWAKISFEARGAEVVYARENPAAANAAGDP